MAGKKWHQGKALASIVAGGRLNAEATGSDIGVSAQTLYRWNKSPELPDRVISRIAAHYGLREEWLRTGEGPKFGTANQLGVGVERRIERLMIAYEAEIKRATRRYTREVVKALGDIDIYPDD